MKQKRIRGFSLMELTMVLAIIGVVSAIAIPRYGSAVSHYRADAAARRIAGDLALIQSSAKVTSKDLTVVFDVATSTYSVAGLRSLNNAATFSVDLTADPYGARLVSATFNAQPQVTLDAYGTPSSGGTVVLRVGSTQRTVTVNAATGAVTIQ